MGFLGFSAIAFLGSGLTALSQEPPASGGGKSCFDSLKETKDQDQTLLRSKRVELYYYRNADNIVNILSQLPIKGSGCVTTLPLNAFMAGKGVGRGGGNIILLYGNQEYIANAQRFITSLDLPLPGINLQLWGAQISSKNPDKLAKTISKVRWRITETQRLLRTTFDTIQGISQFTLQGKNPIVKVDSEFTSILEQLGYKDAIDGLGGESSILEVFLVGKTVDQSALFYKALYNSLAAGKIENGRFVAENQNLQPYFDALKNDINRPPFERIFRSRGLEPHCIYPPQYKELKKEDENKELKCEQWKWEEEKQGQGEEVVSLVEITANFERKVLLEFAFHYADFVQNPEKFDPGELQRTADNLNELLQKLSNLLQKDIEDFFIKPTLAMIQKEVGDNRGVDFAQVGRSTISTLNEVATKVSTSSTSGFQISQSQDLGQLLSRAETLQEMISNFLPTEALGGASEAGETAATGGVPISRLLGLAVAALEQNSIPLAIETGTNLTFTPGISRNLSAAELNIHLIVTDPTVTPTAEKKNVPPISRIGRQELHTTVYTQALDFFDLSTFTSQATLDGGRFRIPIIGQLWHGIFGAIPVFGDLFSVSRRNQNVLHESLILTNSFITPTPLSLGNLYSPNNAMPPFKDQGFCTQIVNFKKYFDSLPPRRSISGIPSFNITKNLEKRCPSLIETLGDLKFLIF